MLTEFNAPYHVESIAERQVARIANDEIRMTKLEGMTNDRTERFCWSSCFEFISSFDIRGSSFCRSRSEPSGTVYNTIVSPRAGPTLTMESFAPASSAMYLTYFLAAKGSCENLRAVCMDVFQPATSS